MGTSQACSDVPCDISCVILAGGANRRFGGSPKTHAIVEGKTIISGIISITETIFDEIIIVTNTPGKYNEYSRFKITCDHFARSGPLAGIHAGMKYSQSGSVFIFAGDMPFLDRNIIIRQIEEFKTRNCEILVPGITDFIEPLHAIYNKSVFKELESTLVSGNNYSVRDFIKGRDTFYMILEDNLTNRKAFSNFNSREDLERYISDGI